MGAPQLMAYRLLVDAVAPGAWNMAVDEAIARGIFAPEEGCLRFYRWSPATLSLGYFQPYADRGQHPASRHCPVVRRASGGGAILHDRELTYSMALPAQHPLGRHPGRLYREVHESLVETLVSYGIDAHVSEAATARPASQEPFLCFQRRTAGDVLIGDVKIAGSAQRRMGRVVLQHGSVLLETSNAAPELPGIAEVSGVRITAGELIERWLTVLTRRQPVEFRRGQLADEERRVALRLCDERYRASGWTNRK